jgi:hypothetical protein
MSPLGCNVQKDIRSDTVLHSKLNDDTCRLLPEFSGHPITRGMRTEFVVSIPCRWKINDILVRERMPAFSSIGASDTKGTLVRGGTHTGRLCCVWVSAAVCLLGVLRAAGLLELRMNCCV